MTRDINEAIQSLSGQAWGLISKLTGKGYDSTNAQLQDMVKVGGLAQSLLTLRAAKAAMDLIPDRDGPAKPQGRKPKSTTSVATPPAKGPGITPLGQATGDGKAHVVASDAAPDLMGYTPDTKDGLDNLPDFEGMGASDAYTEGMDLSGEDK